MFTPGSKFFFGFAGAAMVAAFFYAIGTSAHEVDLESIIGPLTLGYKGRVGDHLGYSVLVALATASAFLGCVSVAFRDADAEALAQVSHLDHVPEPATPQGTNFWPIVGAFGFGCVVVGVVVGAPLVILGAAAMGVSAFEWAIRAWSERITGDPEVNRAVRNRVMYPIEVPLLSVVAIAVLILAVSRVLLAVPKLGGYLVFGLVPAAILGLGWAFSRRDKVNATALTVLLLVGGVGIIVAGIAAAAVGPRDIEPHGEEHGEEEGAPALPPAPGDPVVVRSGT